MPQEAEEKQLSSSSFPFPPLSQHFQFLTIIQTFWGGWAELGGQQDGKEAEECGQGAQGRPYLSVSLSLSIQGILVRLKLSQDEMKKSCQYSRCAQKEENWVRMLFLAAHFYIPLQIEITRSNQIHWMLYLYFRFYHVMANKGSSKIVVALLWIPLGLF